MLLLFLGGSGCLYIVLHTPKTSISWKQTSTRISYDRGRDNH